MGKRLYMRQADVMKAYDNVQKYGKGSCDVYGGRRRSKCCPIAVALRRVFHTGNVEVTGDTARVNGTKYNLCNVGRDITFDFDLALNSNSPDGLPKARHFTLTKVEN